MIATRQDSFQPVILTLQTQHEVDALHAIFDNPRIRRAMGFENPLHQVLQNFRSMSSVAIFGRVNNLLQ